MAVSRRPPQQRLLASAAHPLRQVSRADINPSKDCRGHWEHARHEYKHNLVYCNVQLNMSTNESHRQAATSVHRPTSQHEPPPQHSLAPTMHTALPLLLPPIPSFNQPVRCYSLDGWTSVIDRHATSRGTCSQRAVQTGGKSWGRRRRRGKLLPLANKNRDC